MSLGGCPWEIYSARRSSIRSYCVPYPSLEGCENILSEHRYAIGAILISWDAA